MPLDFSYNSECIGSQIRIYFPPQKDDMCLSVRAFVFVSRVYMQFNTLKKITKTKRR